MKGKFFKLTCLSCALILLPGCSLFNWWSDEPQPDPVQPPTEVQAAAEKPTPPPSLPPAKPLTAKERKQAAALEKKQAEEARKQAERDLKAGKKQPKDAVEVAKAKLDAFAKQHVLSANANLRPNRTNMETRKDGSQYMTFYNEVDVVTLKTEIYPGNKPGCQYVGHVVYIENLIASYGPTEKEARNGVFKQVKSKRIRELTRYDNGKWHY